MDRVEDQVQLSSSVAVLFAYEHLRPVLCLHVGSFTGKNEGLYVEDFAVRGCARDFINVDV
mgnify:CR=1 FL=1